MRVTDQELAVLNDRFADASPLQILRFAHSVFGSRAALLCGMQRAGTLLCHLSDRAGLGLDVLFVDTGVMHAETLRTRDELARTHPNLRVITLSPERSFADQTTLEGLLYLTPDGQERCCELRKSEPLLAVRGRYDAFIGALRADEGGARALVKPFAIDRTMNALRVHPLAFQDRGQLDALVAAHPEMVLNPLHAMGFPTIGCFPCTTPVRQDEPERAGRWRHLAGVEYCRMNPVDRGEQGAAIELDDRYAELVRHPTLA
jgi:phosphoadenosine phosphosulfate reductase